MKRKDFEEIHLLNFSSRKSRRLEDPIEVDDEGLSSDTEFTTNCMLQTNASTIDPPPLTDHSDSQDKAIVPYHQHYAPFLNSPNLFAFPIILNSDFIPGIRDHIFWPRNSETANRMEAEVISNRRREESDDSLAVVPWLASRLPVTSAAEGQARGLSETAGGEEEMDTDEANASSTGGEAFEFGGILGGVEARKHWNQHCMEPQQIGNTNTTISW
ncbi:uncharacterized protein LOC125369437 isoform X2 [Ricinus communis]|uniref:uncharacterized protein LOC125369437 isoform X2 n=1 Tax=Ricinus communis TaxID=3988 RepID=UPI00201B2A2E|nr:uncharacterized protein LOC125369437 isoform X2 [Ricinus communis]